MAQLKDSLITGSLRVTDTIFSTNLNLSSLTASYAVLTDANKNLVSRGITNNTSATAVTASTNLITANTLYYHKGNSNIVTVGTISSGTWHGTTIGTAYGGTGNTSFTQWGVIYANPATKLVSTAAGTSGYLLQGNGSAAPSWIQATNANTGSTIVKRDASGNFNAGTINVGYLEVRAQDSTHEGGEIKLLPATSSLKTCYIDNCDSMLRIHDGSSVRFYVDVTTGNTTITGQCTATQFNGPLSGNATTATTASYLDTPNSFGYSTDEYGNLVCKYIGEGTAYFHLDNNAKNVSMRYYWDSGDVWVPGKVGIGYNPTTSGNTHSLYVNGTSYFTNTAYFGNGTTYNINNSGTATLNGIYGSIVWANQGTSEKQVGVSHSTNSGNLYLYANNSSKGLYSSSGYKTGTIIGIDSSAVTFYGALSGNASTATALSNIVSDQSASNVQGALQAFWNAQKSTMPKDKIIGFTSYNSGRAMHVGYFISGYDSNPYGGFFTAFYDTPYYSCSANGTFSCYELVRNDSRTYSINVSGSSGSCTGNAASATRINGNLGGISDSNAHNIWVSSGTGADGVPKYISGVTIVPSSKTLYINNVCCTNVYCPNYTYHLAMQNDGNLVIYSGSGGVVWSTGTSTKYVKEHINSITDIDISNFMRINPVSFNYKPEMNMFYNSKHYGVIAEELLDIYPNLVEIPENYDQTKFDINKGFNQPLIRVNYEGFIPLLIKMVQKQQKEINELREQLNKFNI